MRPLVLACVLTSTLAVASTITGCSEGPARGFERFYEGLGSAAALEHMSARSLAKLDDGARAALITTPPRMTLKRVRVLEEQQDTAILEVEDTLGATERVTMVREDGAWRVQL